MDKGKGKKKKNVVIFRMRKLDLNHTKAQIAKNGGVINHQHREIFITDTFIECLGKKKVADMGFSIVSIKHF